MCLCRHPVILLLATLPWLGACAGPHRQARNRSDIGDLAPGDFLAMGRGRMAPAEVAAATSGARYVLIGESHDEACDHRAQATVLAALADAGQPPVVGLEQVDVERQPVLDRYSQGELELAALSTALEWQEQWGVDFDLYRPIFAEAGARGLPLVALNLPAPLVRAFSEKGADGLRPEERALLPAEILPPPPDQEAWLREVFAAHPHGNHGGGQGSGAEDPVARFVRVQSLWDTEMASRAVDAATRFGRPVAILAGIGHVEQGWGIESRLVRLDPGAEVLSILPWRGGEEPDPAAADLFFFCPANPGTSAVAPPPSS